MMTRYDLAYLLLSPVGVPYLAWRWARRRKYRQSGPGMIGRDLPGGEDAKKFENGSVWIHAVSVGEVAAAKAIEPGLRELFPNLPFVISTITETGQEAARRTIPNAEAHTYFPIDFSWNVQLFLDAYHPRIVVIMETEIWPNFITLARESGADVFLVNGKLSDRSFPRYLKIRGLLRNVFDSVSGFCVQTAEDERRFRALGVGADRIRVTGNVKFDLAIPRLSVEERVQMRAELGVSADQPVIVAGSTHETEEDLILDAYRKVREVIPNACLVMAPRHPERFGVVSEIAKGAGFKTRLATEITEGTEKDSEVVVLNKMGVLARTYGVGDVAIVAGSFCAVGGHNLLEAAAHAIPVIYGPNMKSQREIAHLFGAAGAGTQVEPAALAGKLIEILQKPELREVEGEKAFDVLKANQGSAKRSADAIRNWAES